MFSTEERCHYRKHQLAEVICQLRFPKILSIDADAPVGFQEAIRSAFPQYSSRMETPPPKLVGERLTPSEAVKNHQFVSSDGHWRVNLTGSFISLACNRYTCWEDFAAQLDLPLATFIKLYRPAYFERVGLRYLNFISRSNLELENVPFRELISRPYLGLLGDDEIVETSAGRSTVDAELSIRGGCLAKIHAGPGLVKLGGRENREIHFIFDLDLYMPGQIAVNLSAGALSTLHSQSYSIFRGAITDTLHEAMQPDDV